MTSKEVDIKVTTTGSAGSATGTGVSENVEFGFLEAIQIDYHASAPATTDVTISETNGMTRTFLTRTNTATNGTFYPRFAVHDNTGTAITGAYTPALVCGRSITVSVAQCDALTNAVVVRLIFSGVA